MKLPSDIRPITKLTWKKHAARNISFFVSSIHLKRAYIKEYQRYIGTRFLYVMAEGKGQNWMMYRNIKEQEKIDAKLDELVKSKQFLRSMVTKTDKSLANFKKTALKIEKVNTKKASDKKIIKLLETFAHAWGLYGAAVSTIIFTGDACGRYLKSILKKRKLTKKEIDKTLGVLTTPIKLTLPVEEEMELIERIERVRSDKKAIGLLKKGDLPPLLAKHFQKHFWLTAYVDDDPWTKSEFFKRIRDALKEKDLSKRVVSIKKHAKDTEKEIERLISDLKLDPLFIRYFRYVIYHRILGESIYGYSNVRIKDTFKEIARRLYLSVDQVKYLTKEEIWQALSGKFSDMKEVIEERMRHYIIVTSKKNIHIFSGKNAARLLKSLKIKESRISKKTNSLVGTSASGGLVRAKAKVVKSVEEIDKVKKGDVLVTLNTTPSFVPAMKKASAIVTDEGGVTCHAAIVSRELGIPCVIGTNVATKVLKDGDMVEVDATKGVVRKL